MPDLKSPCLCVSLSRMNPGIPIRNYSISQTGMVIKTISGQTGGEMTPKLLQILILSLVILVATTARADSLKGKVIHICEDAAEWPPYHYLERENGKKTEEIVGYGIDVLDRIFGKHGISYKIDFLPWKRCLAEVKKGGKYQMALSGSYSRERDDAYHLVNWYKTTVYYFYSKKRHPQGLKIEKLSDLENYDLGGVRGYNYYFLGEYEQKMDKGAENIETVIKKMSLGRFDLTFEQYEIFSGFRAIGYDHLGNQDLGFAKLPGVEPTWFNMMISKNYVHSPELKKILSEGIAQLFWSGEHKILLEKHGLTAD